MPHDLYPGVVDLPFNHIADPFRTGVVHAENVIHKCGISVRTSKTRRSVR